ncbi:hypothetical protein F441_11416 [Phytophthora nicotianae CJ01A1]|nr:hypothetical protein F443_11497 [Phytophthora nicotianae P1569]ETO72309.1 hypothetical protein F444_11569 [Phytophthora nicotianae P1976]ETP13429.1 hypothetical protein F441_11416 [Phytophthora nicotianae CJ01A1]ETP41501.1 hypothetical protein F442_11392 [Phytophthora nicotianae P10297]
MVGAAKFARKLQRSMPAELFLPVASRRACLHVRRSDAKALKAFRNDGKTSPASVPLDVVSTWAWLVKEVGYDCVGLR